MMFYPYSSGSLEGEFQGSQFKGAGDIEARAGAGKGRLLGEVCVCKGWMFVLPESVFVEFRPSNLGMSCQAPNQLGVRGQGEFQY